MEQVSSRRLRSEPGESTEGERCAGAAPRSGVPLVAAGTAEKSPSSLRACNFRGSQGTCFQGRGISADLPPEGRVLAGFEILNKERARGMSEVLESQSCTEISDSFCLETANLTQTLFKHTALTLPAELERCSHLLLVELFPSQDEATQPWCNCACSRACGEMSASYVKHHVPYLA